MLIQVFFCLYFPETQDRAKSVRSLATEFSPMSGRQEAQLNNSDLILKEMADRFRKSAPKSGFIRLYDMIAPDRAQKVPLPPNISALVNKLDKDQPLDIQVNTLLQAMQLSADQRSEITKQTKEQSFSSDWKSQKVGRITASISKRCYTRARTLMEKPDEDPRALISEIMQYKSTPCIGSMKYGLSMEPRAKLAFPQIMKGLKHKKFTSSDPGLIIHEREPFIGASPDLMVACECHGEGVCEIKCPVLFEKITPENYEHVIECDGILKLKHTSAYYFQIQHQLGVTGRNYGYFFAYTNCDYVIDKIVFDSSLWQDMMERFDYLWRKFVAPELIQGIIGSEMKKNQVLIHGHEYSASSDRPGPSHRNAESLQVEQTPKARPKHYLTKAHYEEQYLCSYCAGHLPNDPDDQSGASIECSDCKSWWHFGCLDFVPMDTSGVWFCPNCSDLE